MSGIILHNIFLDLLRTAIYCISSWYTVANGDQADVDGDNVGDICDNCPNTYNPTQWGPGDANGDGGVNLGDAGFVINYIFYDGSAPEPMESGDANGDGGVNLGDAGYIINYIFYDGPEPACS